MVGPRWVRLAWLRQVGFSPFGSGRRLRKSGRSYASASVSDGAARLSGEEGDEFGDGERIEFGRLQGKTTLITGIDSGIGRQAALLFAHEGANVAVADRNFAVSARTTDTVKISDLHTIKENGAFDTLNDVQFIEAFTDIGKGKQTWEVSSRQKETSSVASMQESVRTSPLL